MILFAIIFVILICVKQMTVTVFHNDVLLGIETEFTNEKQSKLFLWLFLNQRFHKSNPYFKRNNCNNNKNHARYILTLFFGITMSTCKEEQTFQLFLILCPTFFSSQHMHKVRNISTQSTHALIIIVRMIFQILECNLLYRVHFFAFHHVISWHLYPKFILLKQGAVWRTAHKSQCTKKVRILPALDLKLKYLFFSPLSSHLLDPFQLSTDLHSLPF